MTSSVLVLLTPTDFTANSVTPTIFTSQKGDNIISVVSERVMNNSLVYMPDFVGSTFLKWTRALPRKERFDINLVLLVKSAPEKSSKKGIILYNGPSGGILTDRSEFFLLFVDAKGLLTVNWNYGDKLQIVQYENFL